MPKKRKMKWGMLLTAGLSLAASLVVAPLGAYAADVPTPELKDTYELENSVYVNRSPSGRYVLYGDKSESVEKFYLLDTQDWSRTVVETTYLGDDYKNAHCFSADEQLFYCYNRTNGSVIVYDLSKGESEEYPLGSAVPSYGTDGIEEGLRLQVSKDNKTLYISSRVHGSDTRNDYAVFSVVDFKNGNTTAKYEYSPSDDYFLSDIAWISTDGKYGYVIQNYCGDDYDSHSYYDVVTLDLNSEKTVNSSEFDKSGYSVVVNDDGAAVGASCYVSKEGDATCTYYSNLEYNTLNQDGSLVLGLYNEDCHGLGSSSSELESLEMIVVDNKTGETKWRTKYPSDLRLINGNDYGALSKDGRFVLANDRDANDNNLLYLIDTKTGAHSQINLRGSLEYAGSSDDRSESAWFSKDCSLIYAVQEGKDDGFRIDVYKSGISQQSLSSDSQKEDNSSSFNPIFIVVIVAILIAAGVGGFFVIRMRKHSKAFATAGNSTAYTAPQQTMPQNYVGQQAQAQPQQAPALSDAPRFCSSCGSPLTPDSQFCPHCGAPVKH